MKNLSKLSFILYGFYWIFLSSCGGPISVAPPSNQGYSEPDGIAEERPGLATQWGETRTSRVKNTRFTRADDRPTATATIYYNNREGIAAMSGLSHLGHGAPTWLQVEPYGFVSVGLRSQYGQFFEGLTVNGKRYVIGEAGRRYSIVVRNNTDVPLEAVLSVDGLDVIDGKPAAFGKHGYVIAPYATLTVDGFRQSMDAVAAFRFGAITESYAEQKYGDTRNVGVIGLAIFHEWQTNPFSQWTGEEVRKRHQADPFPERFATPP